MPLNKVDITVNGFTLHHSVNVNLTRWQMVILFCSLSLLTRRPLQEDQHLMSQSMTNLTMPLMSHMTRQHQLSHDNVRKHEYGGMQKHKKYRLFKHDVRGE